MRAVFGFDGVVEHAMLCNDSIVQAGLYQSVGQTRSWKEEGVVDTRMSTTVGDDPTAGRVDLEPNLRLAKIDN